MRVRKHSADRAMAVFFEYAQAAEEGAEDLMKMRLKQVPRNTGFLGSKKNPNRVREAEQAYSNECQQIAAAKKFVEEQVGLMRDGKENAFSGSGKEQREADAGNG